MLKNILLCIFWVVIFSCKPKQNIPLDQPHETANLWVNLTLHITKTTPNTPTFASRALGYIGLTMYESVVHSDSSYLSLSGQLNGLSTLPVPQKGQEYEWLSSMNAAQAQILRHIYIHTSNQNKTKIDSLENSIHDQLLSHYSNSVTTRSADYGREVADAIFEWSKTDGGHRGYLNNFDKKLITPTVKGNWLPPAVGQSFSRFPLHPYWGKNRTFLSMDAHLKDPTFIAYNTSPNSEYYKQHLAVKEKNAKLTQSEKEAALWWGDDPADTFTPPGHSYYLASLAVQKSKPSLTKTAQTYASVGMAVADAFVDCWKYKYQYFSERPSTFLMNNVDNLWEAFWPDPPFPAFPSGHATQAAAMATVLTNLYGENLALTDSAHAGRERDELRNVDFKPRYYHSFWQAAEECANSRFYGGIHTHQDNDEGLEIGRQVGANINGLVWRK